MGAVLSSATALQVLPRPSRLGSQFATNVGDPVFLMWQMTTQSHRLLSPMQGNIFHPHTDVMAYSDALISYLPVFSPVLALSGGNPVAAYNAVAFAGYLVGAVAVYALSRRLLADRLAALVAALLFTLSPYRSAAVAHVQLVGFCFVVLALLLVVRFLDERRWRDAVGAGLMVGLTWLGSLYCAMMLVCVLPPFLAVWSLQHARRLGPRLWRGALLAAVAAALLVAPTLPAYIRVERSGVISRGGSSLISAHLASFERLPAGTIYRAFGRGEETPDLLALYPGSLLLALAGVAAVAAAVRLARGGRLRRPAIASTPEGSRRPGADAAVAAPAGGGAPRSSDPGAATPGYALPLAAALVVCGFVLVGPDRGLLLSEPDRVLRRVVPGMSDIRDLTRFWLVWLLGLALAAGLGVRVVMRRLPVRAAPLFGVFVCLLAGLELVYGHTMATVDDAGPAAAADRVLAGLPAGVVVELPLPPPDTFAYAVTVAPRQLRSALDGDPRVEGYSGTIPDDVRALIAEARRLPDAAALDRLRREDVRYLVVHVGATSCAGAYSPGEAASLIRGLGARPGVVARVIPAGRDIVVELVPATAGAPGSEPTPGVTAPSAAAVCGAV